MNVFKSTIWLIMSKDRTLVAKGTVRSRCLVRVDDIKNKQRFLTYSSKGKAESAFRVSGFYGQGQIPIRAYGKDLGMFLEAVPCNMSIDTIDIME